MARLSFVAPIFLIISAGADPAVIRISTPSTELVFQQGATGELMQVYFGPKDQSPQDLPEPKAPDGAGYGDPDPGSAYPGGGSTFIGKAAVRARHADGNTST